MSFLDATTGDSSKLEKLIIVPEENDTWTDSVVFDEEAKITVRFNPNQLRYANQVQWRSSAAAIQSVAAGYQAMELQATPPGTLTLDLFFDTYEGESSDGGLLSSLRNALPDNPLSAGVVGATDVRVLTRQITKLASVQKELHRPPICKLIWGKEKLFQGVLSQVNQDFNFFTSGGIPVRATLACTFTAYQTFQEAAAASENHSADVHKRRVLRRGDTLSSIAQQEYGDAGRWREIARENGIDNPRALQPGQVLVLPKLTV